MGLNQKAKCWGELHWEHQPPNDPQFWNCSADAGFDQGFWRINFVSPLLGDLSTFQGKFWIHYEVSTLRVIVPTFQANSLSRWWPFAIHNILWHSRTLQVGYSTTSKPPVSKPGLINPGWWFSMDYPQNHPRLVIKITTGNALSIPSTRIESWVMNNNCWSRSSCRESYNPTVSIFTRSTSMIPSSTICRSVFNIHQHILRQFLKIGMLPTHWLHYWLIIA